MIFSQYGRNVFDDGNQFKETHLSLSETPSKRLFSFPSLGKA